MDGNLEKEKELATVDYSKNIKGDGWRSYIIHISSNT